MDECKPLNTGSAPLSKSNTLIPGKKWGGGGVAAVPEAAECQLSQVLQKSTSLASLNNVSNVLKSCINK